jgi:subtilisin family serine protease
VIAVGAHDASYRETIYSNHGKELALLAPGGDTTRDANRDRKPDGILQGTITSKGWGYAMLEGTSMASPHVAGAAALLVSVGVKGPDAVRAALIGGSKENSGNRILDVNGALDYAGVGAGTVAPAASGTEPVATAPATGTAPATSAPTPGEGRPARGEGRASAGGGKAGKAGGKGEGKAGGKKRPH